MRAPRPTLVGACLAAALSSAACGTPAGSSRSTSSTEAATTSTVAWAGLSLGGLQLTDSECPPPAVNGPSTQVAASAVSEVLICPPRTPDPSGSAQSAVTVGPSSPSFRPLLVALAAPDEPRRPGQICPMYVQVPQPVVARTGSGSLLVHIPVDSCGHYRGAAVAAIAAARRGWSPRP